MKTYKTFAECKLAHPECDVYRNVHSGDFSPELITPDFDKCNPADYLMSLARFLDKGFRLVKGDYFLDHCCRVMKVKYPDLNNKPVHWNYARYVLKAKALESSEPETQGNNMKTYKTFSECKLAHPECDVYRTAYGNDFAPEEITPDYAKRNPADFLMSMEEFLGKGFKFEVGDIYLGSDSHAYLLDDTSVVALVNKIDETDKNRYILKAKALESCTSHGIAAIQSASGHIEPIECEPVEQVLRRLSAEIDRALQSTSLSNGMRECLKAVISQVDDELLIQEAYSLHCEFYGNDAADFCAFKDDVGGRSLWLHFAKKLQEQA